MLTKDRAAEYKRLRTQQKRHESFARDLVTKAKDHFRYNRAVLRNLAILHRYHNCSPELNERLTSIAQRRRNNG